MSTLMQVRIARDERQSVLNRWVARAFGARFLNPYSRMERLFEEVGELGQALDFPEEEAIRVIRLAYAGKKGVVGQEIGGVTVCMLSLCEVLGVSAEACELEEVDRLLAKDLTHFQEKLKAKLASGICSEPAA